MKRANAILGCGLLGMGIIQMLKFLTFVPDWLHIITVVVCLGMEIAAIVLMTRTKEFQESKFKKWQLRLIGKEK